MNLNCKNIIEKDEILQKQINKIIRISIKNKFKRDIDKLQKQIKYDKLKICSNFSV